MSIDIASLRQQALNQWEHDNLWVLPYRTKRSGNADSVSEFIWQFKSGDMSAFYAALELLSDAIREKEEVLRMQYGCSVIASAPSSRQGFPKPLPERVCAELATRHGWLTHVPRLLQRTQTVKAAHLSRPGERPNFGTHLQTISCGGRYNLEGRNVLLFDDLLTSGDTSLACTAILKDEANCGAVVGLYLGRTQR